MKKSLTEEWMEIGEARERFSYDLFNPLADFIASLPPRAREELLDIIEPNRKQNAIKGQIRASWRTYRLVRKYYFIGPPNDSQRWAMETYKSGIRKNIKKLRKLKSNTNKTKA